MLSVLFQHAAVGTIAVHSDSPWRRCLFRRLPSSTKSPDRSAAPPKTCVVISEVAKYEIATAQSKKNRMNFYQITERVDYQKC